MENLVKDAVKIAARALTEIKNEFSLSFTCRDVVDLAGKILMEQGKNGRTKEINDASRGGNGEQSVPAAAESALTPTKTGNGVKEPKKEFKIRDPQGPVSEKQVWRLKEIAGKLAEPGTTADSWLLDYFKVKELNEVTKAQASEAIDELQQKLLVKAAA